MGAAFEGLVAGNRSLLSGAGFRVAGGGGLRWVLGGSLPFLSLYICKYFEHPKNSTKKIIKAVKKEKKGMNGDWGLFVGRT